MKLRGKGSGKTKLHSKDATFCGVDVYPPEVYESPVDDTAINYTGVIVPKAEFFEGLPQWKDTESLDQRIEILKSILEFISQPESRSVLCFNVHTTKEIGWGLGKALLDDVSESSSRIERLSTRKGVRYRMDGKRFSEQHTVTLFTYACVLAIMFQDVAREVTKSESLASLRNTVLQFLVDNVSGDPAPGVGTQWYLDLIYFLIEESPLEATVKTGLAKSTFDRFGISVPIASQVVGEAEITGHKDVPLMVATDWFTKILSRAYEVASVEFDELDEDDRLIREIVATLERRKCLIRSALPRIVPPGGKRSDA